MELYQAIIQKKSEKFMLDNETIVNVINSECYKALEEIRRILKDDSLSDQECFNKIEEIVCVFESLGSGCGTRHDFG